jgi:hypothetical protein
MISENLNIFHFYKIDVRVGVVMSIIIWIRDNGWIIPFITVYLAHLFAKWRDWSSKKKQKKKFTRDIKGILAIELMANLDFLSSIHRIHRQNEKKNDEDFIPFLPTRTPRFAVLEKLFNQDILLNMNERDRYNLANIHGRLSKFEREFYIWREKLFYNLLNDKGSYNQASLIIMNGYQPLIESIMELWVSLARNVGESSVHPVVKNLNKILKEFVKSGEWVVVSYNSSSAERMYGNQYERASVIVCWNNDLIEIPNGKKIMCIQDIIPESGI